MMLDHSNIKSNKYGGLGGQKGVTVNEGMTMVIGVIPPEHFRRNTNESNRAWPSYTQQTYSVGCFPLCQRIELKLDK